MIIKGKAYYAKILGAAPPGYQNGPNEWSMEVSLDADTVKLLKEKGLGPKIKNKGDDRGDYITFKRKAVKLFGEKKGQPNNPIPVIDAAGRDWPQDVKIGNGSIVNVAFNINERPGYQGRKSTVGADILKVQVWEHTPYQPKSEFPTKPEDEVLIDASAVSEEKDW